MYSARMHAHYIERNANFARALRQLQIEAVAILEMKTNQADGAPDYTDTADVSTVELDQVGELAGDYLNFLTGDNAVVQEDRRPITTPFLQGI